MARLACADIPFFSLQVLFRAHPEWRAYPAAVVDRDEATGRLLTVNEAARVKGIRPGLPYSQALSLSGDLRAAPVSRELLEAVRREVVETLSALAPEVEVCRLAEEGREGMGAFWLNIAGLGTLYPSLSRWMGEAIEALGERGFSTTIAVGFTRFGSYVVARARRKPIVLPSPEEEERLMRRAPLRVLPLSPETLALLLRLGIETVGSFLDLPEAGVAKRFGREAQRIFRWAQRERLPIQPFVVEHNARIERGLDDPIANLLLLTTCVDELLDGLLEEVRGKQKLLGALTIELFAEGELRAREMIQPAVPTGEAAVLKKLTRLRLAEQRYEGAVDRIALSAEEIDPLHQNGELFVSPREQAGEAGRRAFALIRARLGNEAVRRALLRDEHLPEERYRWEAVDAPLFPAPFAKESSPEARYRVVRRLFTSPPPPGPLPQSARLVAGPFLVAGKWWLEEEGREYYFALGSGGRLLWLYRNEARGGWVLQGMVD